MGKLFYESYQLSLLYNPTESEFEMEQQGQINIYVGINDKQVDAVMDAQYERIIGMMLTSVIVPDDSGKAFKNSKTGAALVEEDGCD